MSYESPVRAALRDSIYTALTNSNEPLTVGEITTALGEDDAREIARLCYEMRTKAGLIEFGEPRFSKSHGKDMKTYKAMSVDSAEAWAARVAASDAVAKVQPKKAKKATFQPASPAHPWKQAVVPPKAPRAPRVTRPLPSHLQSKSPPPVADNSHLAQWTEIVEPTGVNPPFIAHEPPFVLDPDLDSALIAALQETVTDLPQAITTEEETMAEDPSPYIADPYAFTHTTQKDETAEKKVYPWDQNYQPESVEDEAPTHECQGHCSNHAVEHERQAMMDAVARDLLENCRLAIVDAMVLYAARELRGDLVWDALYQAYSDAAGSHQEVCHG